MRKTFVILCLQLLTCISFGQTRNVNIDSVEQLVLSADSDSFKIYNLLYLVYLESYENPKDAHRYSKIVRSIAARLPHEEAFLKIFYMRAKIYLGQGYLDSAKIFLDSLVSFNQIGNYPEIACDCHKALGHFYKDSYQSDLAIEHYIKSIEIGKVIGDDGCYGGCSISLGGMHQDLKNYEKANLYYEQALESLRSSKRHHIVSDVYRSLAKLKESYIEKMIYLDSSEIYAKKADNRSLLFYTFWDKAIIDVKHDKRKKAIANYERTLEYYNQMEDPFFPKLLMEMAVLYWEEDRKNDAMKMFYLSTDALQAGDKILDRSFHNNAAQFYEHIGNTKKALDHKKWEIIMMDSLSNEEMLNAVMASESKYQSEIKEKEITIQKLEIAEKDSLRNRLIGGGIIGFLFLTSIFSWYYNVQKRKKQIAELALEKEKLESHKLQELDEMKMQFFTNVSHELKTPLTLVLGPLSQALEKTEDEGLKKNIVTAYNNAERLNDLINETLDFRKLEKGTVQINPTSRYISSDLKRMFYGFSSLAEIRDIALVDHITFEEGLHLSIDIGKLEKIVNNLVSNALKFSKNESSIEFTAQYESGLLKIDVRDYGIGIEEEETDKIFNRFYQAKHNLQGNYGGTGVGLAFSKELAEVLNGSLSVESEVGKGSVFKLELPVEISQHEPSTVEDDLDLVKLTDRSNYIPILINGEKPDILIVEDNREMQEYLKSILQEEYNCHIANDGFDAINKVQMRNYHLISSDVMMPNMDGFRLKEKINDIPQANSVPFIFLTARSLEEDKLAGLRLGVDDYITKPFNKDEYQARVYNLLKNYNERIDVGDLTGQFKYTESVDEGKLKEAERKVLENLSNPNFKVNELAEHLHYSQRQLSRVIKQMTGMTPVGFILELRLQRAYHLIKFKAYESVSEVRYEVGIESSSYFSRKFKERFGVNPSEV